MNTNHILTLQSGANRTTTVRRRGLLLVVALFLAAAGVRWYVDMAGRSFSPVGSDPRILALTEKAKRLRSDIERNPRNVEPRWKLADIYQQLGAITQAQEELKGIVALQPQSAEALIALANTHLATDEWRDAEKLYRKVTTSSTQRAEGFAGLAVALYHQQKYNEAIVPARKSLHLNANNPDYHLTLGICYLELAESYPNPGLQSTAIERAIGHFRQTLRAWPSNGDVYFRIARCYSALGQTREALRWLKRSAELAPQRTDIAIMLAQRYKRAGNLEAARPLAAELIAAHPENAALQSLWGELLMSSTAPDALAQMLQACRKATSLEPDNAMYWQQLGTACLQMNRDAEAETAFRQAIKLDPKEPFPYQQMASLATRHGKTKDAAQWATLAEQMQWNAQQLKQMELLSQREPSRVPLRLILAERYQALGLLPAARSEYSAVVRLQPDNARAHAGLAALDRLTAQRPESSRKLSRS
jgi:superkiller protein 3